MVVWWCGGVVCCKTGQLSEEVRIAEAASLTVIPANTVVPAPLGLPVSYLASHDEIEKIKAKFGVVDHEYVVIPHLS